MLLLSRPLTLLALGICAYITITWRLRVPQIPSVISIYDENGFRKYDPLETTAPKTGNSVKSQNGKELEDQQRPLPWVAPGSWDAAAAQTHGEQASTKTALPAPTSVPIPYHEYMKDILDWERPKHKNGHWPPYEDFAHKDYDPNRWEAFRLCVRQIHRGLYIY
jgi:hypothetical protein